MSALIILDWIERTQEAEEALRQWRYNLQAWMTHPDVPDEAFMSALQDLSQVIGIDWADSHNLDALREAVTGVDARYTSP